MYTMIMHQEFVIIRSLVMVPTDIPNITISVQKPLTYDWFISQ